MIEKATSFWHYENINSIPIVEWKVTAILHLLANDGGVYELTEDVHFQDLVTEMLQEHDLPVIDESARIGDGNVEQFWKQGSIPKREAHAAWEDEERYLTEYELKTSSGAVVEFTATRYRSRFANGWTNRITICWGDHECEFSHQVEDDCDEVHGSMFVDGEELDWFYDEAEF